MMDSGPINDDTINNVIRQGPGTVGDAHYRIALELRQHRDAQRMAYRPFSPFTMNPMSPELIKALSTPPGRIIPLETQFEADVFDPSLYLPEMMVGDGIALSSISHPRAPFWARVWSWFFPPKMHTDALETTVLDLGNGEGLTYEGFSAPPPANRLEEEIRRRLNEGDQ